MRIKDFIILFIIYNLNYELSAESLNVTTDNMMPENSNPENETMKDVPTADYCYSLECNQTASRVLSYLDSNISPCDNFYKFACGQFLKNTIIPNGNSIVSHFSTIQDKIDNQLKNFLEQETEPTEPKHVKLVKNFYHSCINTTAINQNSIQSAKDLLRRIGGWPLLEGDSWKEEGFRWEDLISRIVKETGSAIGFFPVIIVLDQKNSSIPVLELRKPMFSNAYPFNYYNYMANIAEIFGADKVKDKRELDQIHTTERAMFRTILINEERPIGDYHRMTIRELQYYYPNVLWRKFLSAAVSPYHEIGNDEVVMVQDKLFLRRFNRLIKEISKRDQANHIMWRVVETLTEYLNDDVRQEYINLMFSTTSYYTLFTPRWKTCYNYVSKFLKHPMSAIYIQNFFNKEYKKDASEIVNNILQQFEINLQNTNWLDETTKELALEKIRSVYPYVSYADELLDNEELDKYYKELEVDSKNFLESILNIKKFDHLAMKDFRQPYNGTKWIHREGTFTANSVYQPNLNLFEIQAGILQEVFFNNKIPAYMNYGSMGTLVGHEITHALGKANSHYDKHGNDVDWWQSNSKSTFIRKARCFIRQYGEYRDENTGNYLNPYTAQEENIADNGGMKIAYWAYKRWAGEHDTEPLLPGVNYTQSQLFWISYAQTMCSKMTPNMLRYLITCNEYGTNEFRVVGTLSNRPEFSTDFNCAKGTNMNPEDKCSVW